MYFIDQSGNKFKPKENFTLESFHHESPTKSTINEDFFKDSTPKWLKILMISLLCVLAVGLVMCILKSKPKPK